MDLKVGQKVVVTDGPWKDCLGEYVGEENTLAGILYHVVLEDGTGTLVSFDQIKILPQFEQPTAVTTLPNGIVFDPEKHRLLKNGTVQDIKTGKFLSPPAKEHAPITASNAQAVARLRWERSRERFAAGVALGMTGREDVPEEAWGRVGLKAAELLKQTTSVRGFADLARFAGEAAGFVPMARGREEMQEPQTNEQPLTVVMIAQFIQALPPVEPPPDVIDGEIKD